MHRDPPTAASQVVELKMCQLIFCMLREVKQDCLLANATLSGDRALSIAPSKPICSLSFSGNRVTAAKLLSAREKRVGG